MVTRLLSASTFLVNKARTKAPTIPYAEIKKAVLGSSYTLSIIFIGEEASRKLNRKYRGKNKPTNILSFALSKKEGEVYLCNAVIKREQKKFDRSYQNLVGFLLIHGLFHLKGMTHGSRMERKEQTIRTKFNIEAL